MDTHGLVELRNYILSPLADHGLEASVIVELAKVLKGRCSFIDDGLIKRLCSFAGD
jgi:hypothetical protein